MSVRVDASTLPAGVTQTDDDVYVIISRFEVGKDDRRSIVPATIQGMIEGIVSVGGDYGDVVSVLRIAKSKDYIKDQLAIDPLPKALRTYYRDEESSE